ncbi:transposase [Candidatus Methanoperedens nitroreducens]|uniref:Transposase n=1 Tax=Candidatus Methanoperedens nitratireducens TaxID=1392998 RepID=A0A062V5G4_9EURY|nr:winged helix-turn-helix domain-containing protein [Candidatus Methanoperedens nitroreducens]KCZ71029.1 transposase [Candidatus Methanoperedens nitroreducens]MDJ1421598.1 winged helix-turn-helix domain-containing protein [Candidatus Methanoperedens sp.]
MTITPRGESFLPDFSIDELNDLYQKEGDPKAKIRLLAAILRKEGRTLEEVSFTIKHPLTTVGDWLRRLHVEGISRKNNKKQSGRPKRLTDKQIENLKPILFKSPHEQGFPFIIWTTKLVIQLIEKLYNVSYKPLQVRRILHRLGLSCQKPRPAHRKANKQLQEEFKKNSNNKLNHLLTMDTQSYFWTKASSR